MTQQPGMEAVSWRFRRTRFHPSDSTPNLAVPLLQRQRLGRFLGVFSCRPLGHFTVGWPLVANGQAFLATGESLAELGPLITINRAALPERV